jgi:hypothetical protein
MIKRLTKLNFKDLIDDPEPTIPTIESPRNENHFDIKI